MKCIEMNNKTDESDTDPEVQLGKHTADANREHVSSLIVNNEVQLDDQEVLDEITEGGGNANFKGGNGLNTIIPQRSPAELEGSSTQMVKDTIPKVARTERKDKMTSELQVLEVKMADLQEGSLERMLLEMGLDIKKDCIEMMSKIDSVTTTTKNLNLEVSRIKEEQRSMELRLTFTQGVQTDEKVRLDKALAGVDVLNEQVKVLQGLVQKQDQLHLLSKVEKEEQRKREICNNLYISGVDEGVNEEETGTAQVVKDFFTETMKITKEISIISAMRIGKRSPKTIFVKLKDAKDKKDIFENVSNLKDTRNRNNNSYYINNQLTQAAQE